MTGCKGVDKHSGVTREFTELHEPILVYLSDLEFVAAFKGPKLSFSKTLEYCAFPPFLQQLIEFLELLSPRLCVERILDET